MRCFADVDGKSRQLAAGDLPLFVLLDEDCPDEPPGSVSGHPNHIHEELGNLLCRMMIP